MSCLTHWLPIPSLFDFKNYFCVTVISWFCVKYYFKEMKHLGFDFLSLAWTVLVTISPDLLRHNLSGLAQEYAGTPAAQAEE